MMQNVGLKCADVSWAKKIVPHVLSLFVIANRESYSTLESKVRETNFTI